MSDSGLEVEYQVPTSSQRDHDDDNVIVVESDDEGGADEGEGADDDQEDPDTESYDMEGMVRAFTYKYEKKNTKFFSVYSRNRTITRTPTARRWRTRRRPATRWRS